MSFVLRRQAALSDEAFQMALCGEPRQAARAILAAAEQGVAEAQLLLGQILLDGRGIERDPALAMNWFRICARSGLPMADNMLGRCLEHGWGCEADVAAAARHYRRAAEAGLDWGQYNLANLLATGRGLEKNPQSAFQLYLDAARQGHAKSMNLVGRFYEDGLVVGQNISEAHDWYRRSAEAGDFRGQFSYGAVLLERGDIQEALTWFLRALEHGNLTFLRVSRQRLAEVGHPGLMDMAQRYFARAVELGDERDRQALDAFLRSV
jgi:hypothetical protein